VDDNPFQEDLFRSSPQAEHDDFDFISDDKFDFQQPDMPSLLDVSDSDSDSDDDDIQQDAPIVLN
jgi:hypothetical protein